MPSTTTDRLFGLTTSVAVKGPCRVATTANITLAGLQSIDGIAMAANDRVLVKDQTNHVLNGIYSVQTGDWVRVPDFDGSLDAVNGTLVLVNLGLENEGTAWRAICTDPVVIGTSTITFEQAFTGTGGDGGGGGDTDLSDFDGGIDEAPDGQIFDGGMDG